MAEKEHGRLRQTFAELLSPSAVLQTARGTLTDHDEPVVGGSVKGDTGQDGSSTEGPADGLAAAAAAAPTPQDPREQAFDWRERERADAISIR